MKKILSVLALIVLLAVGSASAATDYKIVNKGGTADPVTLRVFTLGGSWTSVWEATPIGQFRIFDSLIVKGRSTAPAVSSTGETTLYFDTVAGKLLASYSGGAYQPIGAVQSVAGKTGAVTLVEGDVSGLTTDLAGKAAVSHTHAETDITGLTTDLAGKLSTSGTAASTSALQSATTTVNVAAATAPSTGQVLTATDSTHATWQTPAGAGGQTTTLTESTATALNDIAISSGRVVGGEIKYVIESNDGTDFQSIQGRVLFTAVNKSGTITVTMGTPEEVTAVSSGTLTDTVTLVTGSLVVTPKINAVSSLTQTVLRVTYTYTLTN